MGRKRVVVIGGGVGGYAAAIRAARMGARVILVEKDKLGGTCLNRGCVPAKILLHSAKLFHIVSRLGEFGIKVDGNAEILLEKVQERKNSIVSRLRNGLEKLLISNEIQRIEGIAAFVNDKQIKILHSGEIIEADIFIIATGSVSSLPPIPGVEGEDILDSDRALELDVLPKSLCIIGGGVIGVEFAQLFGRFGVKVTMLELMDQLIPHEDDDVARGLENALVQEGIEIRTGVKVEEVKDGKRGKEVVYVDGGARKSQYFERVMVATGRRPYFEGLGLEKIGIETNANGIRVNEYLQTSIPWIYAVGDCTGGLMLAHLAMAEGERAAENALGKEEKMDYRAVPRCVYTSPEIGCVGLTEKQASKREGIEVGRFPMSVNSKALILGENYGFVKIVADQKYGEILGVMILGPHATEIISEGVVAMRAEVPADELARSIHPHPTVSETVMEAAMEIEGLGVHLPPKKG